MILMLQSLLHPFAVVSFALLVQGGDCFVYSGSKEKVVALNGSGIYKIINCNLDKTENNTID